MPAWAAIDSASRATYNYTDRMLMQEGISLLSRRPSTLTLYACSYSQNECR